MLPSTGYFKGINCPFYDSGLCERPYCHFRHAKKDSIAGSSNDGIETGAILQKLVSAAVQKVLQQTEASSTMSPTYLTTPEELGPTTTTNNTQTKATYNPTPIAELKKIIGTETDINDDNVDLKKKHIPVPYTPRKPAGLPIQRPPETNGSPKPFIYNPPPIKYTPGCSEAMKLESYKPKGLVESKETYLPGSDPDIELQEYTPHEAHKLKPTKHNYIPSDKNCNKKKILEYKPSKIKGKTEIPKVTYQPTPKSLNPCFSSDEELEPDIKKFKLNDLNSLDDLGPEFDILDQILDDERPQNMQEQIKDQDVDMVDLSKTKEKSLVKVQKEMDDSLRKHTSSSYKLSDKSKSKNETKLDNQKHSQKVENNHKKHKSSSDKYENRKSESTSKSEKKVSSSHHKNDTKTKESSRKSHKSLNKEKEEKKDRSRDDKKKHSESRKIEKSLKHSENTSKSSRSSSSSRKHLSSSSSRKNLSSSSSSKDSKRESRKKDRHKSSKETVEKHKKRKEIAEIDNDEHDDRHFDGNDLESVPDEENYELSESDEETIALECKKIFEEYVPVAKPTIKVDEVNSGNQSIDNSDVLEYIPGKKRISRTADKIVKIAPKVPVKPDHKVNASQAMAERLAKVKEYHAHRKTFDSNSAPTQQNLAPKSDPPRNTKIRIAHVPYASTLLSAKKTINPSLQTRIEEPSTSSTVTQTVKKGFQRVAHIPNEKFIDRPGVLEPLASKIPANVRSTYLNMMIDECLKIYLSATDAYARAQHEELTTSKKCSKVQVYKNSAVLTVSRLRKELQECNGVKKSGADCTTLQKVPHSVCGTANNLGSWSIENQNRRTVDTSKEFTGVKFYINLKKWILTEEQLQENGFPRPCVTGEKGRAIIYGQNKKPPPRGYIRTCCRCKKDYTVDKKGFPAVKEECIYHPNNKYRVRGEVKYQCCSQDSSSDGCCIAPCHVYEYVDYDNLKGYIKTMPPNSNIDDYGVYSLDCEMCYTTHGLDLTRVTVINSSCKVVYETLIKPLHPIIDYNTRYSGITAEQMANVSTTLLEVQATLLSMFNSKTILIGHSLESDFKALKLIHDTVIDTSVLFPHKMGPPYKRALRNLSSEYLKKIIQNSVEGHDSAEDATVCMELVIYKLKEDLKTR